MRRTATPRLRHRARPGQPRLETLEDRTLLATLYLATSVGADYVPDALVGRSYSLNFQAYGPKALSDGPYTYTESPTSVDGLTFAASGNVLTLSGMPAGAGTYSFTINAKDSNDTDSGNETFTLDVATPVTAGINLDNDATANNIPTANDIPTGQTAIPYAVLLNTAGGNGQYTYTLPTNVDGLTFTSYLTTVTISGTPTNVGSFAFKIGIKDSAGNTGSVPLTLDVGLGLVPGDLPGAGHLTPASDLLAPGLAGAAYNQVIQSSGGSGSLTYTFTQPNDGSTTLPNDGLTLKQVGDKLVLSGTPTTAGNLSFNVSVQDGAGNNDSHTYTLQVVAAPVTLQVMTPDGMTTSPNSLLPAEVGEPWSQQFVAQGGTCSYTWDEPYSPGTTIESNVNNMQFTKNGNLLTLSGTPRYAGTFGYLMAVEDSAGNYSRVQQYWLVVRPKAAGLSLAANGNPDLPPGQVGVPFAQTITAYGAGSNSVRFKTLPASHMPPGLSFSATGTSDVLSGTPTRAGSFPIIIRVSVGAGMVTESYVVTIAARSPLALSRQALPPAMQGYAYNQAIGNNAASAAAGDLQYLYYPYQLTAEGGAGGYTYTATGLPVGMTLAATGHIGGAPTITGVFPVTVTVHDSAGHTASQIYSLSVIPCPPYQWNNPYEWFDAVTYPAALFRSGFGLNNIILSGGLKGDGQGQTIALLESTDDYTLTSSIPGLTLNRPDQVSYADSDLAAFSAANSLPQFASSAGPNAPVFVKLDITGTTDYPIHADPGYGPSENGEFLLDVETIHAIAPEANIVVFIDSTEADYPTLYQKLMKFPHNLPGLPAKTKQLLAGLAPVSVVSSSVGGGYNEYATEIKHEKDFLPPLASQPAAVVIAAGDMGYFPPALTGPEYPGNSASMISAAMSEPIISPRGQMLGELGVSSAGGGPSLYLPQPPWQKGVVNAYSTTKRVAPDIAFGGSFSAALSIIAGGEWSYADGSSAAAPAVAALMAIIDQGRALLKEPPLTTAQALTRLYKLPAGDFQKISQLDDGTNVSANFNTAAGLGSPIAGRLVPDMVGGQQTITGIVHNAHGTGLVGWTVYLDAAGTGTFVPGTDPVAITGRGGRYQFVVAPGSGYQVRVQPPAGTKLVQTSPTPAPISFAPGSHHTRLNVNFRFSPPSPKPAREKGRYIPAHGNATEDGRIR
jgi:hypothetical protein